MTSAPHKKQRFVIIDGNAIIHRAYHALPPLTVKDGTVVNAVFGFTSMLLRVLNELQPTYLAVSFDLAGPTFRDALYDKYKATRVKAEQSLYDQIPLVYLVVEAFDIPIYTKEGFEADDVIGTIVGEVARTKTTEAIIVTGDMDMVQLVDNDIVKIYEPRRGLSDVVLFNAESAEKKFGFPPARLVDYKALRGDVSDNIPGIKGIGEKTAKQLIEKIGGVEDIYRALGNTESNIRELFSPSVIKKLEQGEADARMSKTLATIRTDVPDLNFTLKDCETGVFDLEKIRTLFTRFEFFSLLKRVPGMAEEKPTTPQVKKKKKAVSPTLVTKNNAASCLALISQSDVFACREVVGGKDVFTADLLGFDVVARGEHFYFDWRGLEKKQQEEFLDLFRKPEGRLVGHDLKSLLKTLGVRDVRVEQTLFDIMIASYIINSSTRAHDLRSITLRELGEDVPPGSDQESLFGRDPHIGARELGLIMAVYEKYQAALSRKEDKELFEEMEMKLIPVLADMELAGVAIDGRALEEMSEDVAKEIARLTKKICTLAGEEFNVASSVQLRRILFEKLRLPMNGVKKGKTGYSTAATELEKLRGVHPIIGCIEEHRELSKLQNTYVDVLPGLRNKKTDRIHTTFNQAVTTTGRLSSSDPNLQNIPIRTDLGRKVRNAFVADAGRLLLSADYSQIELRVAAHLAEDKTLIDIFKNGEDVHRATAAAVAGISLEEVTPEMRSAAKAINFGILYGMGTYGLAWRTGMSHEEARLFIDAYFQKFANVKEYVESTIRFARERGYVETLFGRRRYIPELQSNNHQVRSAGERMAVNMPIQGTSADITKRAMIAVHDMLLSDYLGDAQMILQVHDELVVEVKQGLEKELAPRVKSIMEGVAKLRVPIVVDVGIGKRWGETK